MRPVPSDRALATALTAGLAAALAVLPTSCGRLATLDDLPEDRSCRAVRSVGRPPAPPVPDSFSREAEAQGSARQAPAAATGAGDPAAGTGVDSATSSPSSMVDWRLPSETLEVRRLNAWCAGVGPAVVGGWAEPAAVDAEVDTVWVVSWNAHAGGGHLRELVEDLRAGRLTGGGPVEHFVLLLQEAYREGEAVPAHDPALPGGSPVDAGPVGREREDVVRDAEVLGLSLFYAPSMRSGTGEDRGNAILATLPLQDPVAIELPVARQRRVAVAATVSARTSDGRPWQVQVVSVHLENDAAGWVRDEEARLDQGEALLAALPEAGTAIAGGDFNTWTRDRREAVVRLMSRAYPDTPPFAPGPTYRRAWGLLRRYLDYLFFRVPDGVTVHYDRVRRLYNSDHYPLVGAVELSG